MCEVLNLIKNNTHIHTDTQIHTHVRQTHILTQIH